jgi:undecaprenyl-diphosphatase
VSTGAPRERHPGDVVRVVLGVVGVGITAALARQAGVSGFERDLFHVVNDLPDGLRPALGAVMQLGTLWAVAAGAALALVGRRLWLALGLGAAGLTAYFAADFFKGVIKRPRPAHVLAHVIVRGSPVHGYGYPSGHSAVAAALAAVAAAYLPRRARRFVWTLAVIVAFARVYVGAHFPLDVIGGLALGWVIGAAVNLAVGTPTHAIAPESVRAALTACGLSVTALEPAGVAARNSAPFFATADGRAVFVKAVDREHRDADLLFQVWRAVTVRHPDEEGALASAKHEVEHEALAASLALRANVHVGAPVAATRHGDTPAVLVLERIDAHGLGAAQPDQLSDALLAALWKEVAGLRRARVAHGELTLDNVLVDGQGQPWLIDFGHAHVGADDRRLALDVAEVLATTAIAVGPKRAVDAAVAALGPTALVPALPLLQPLALSSKTRRLYRRREHHGALDQLRDTAADAVGVAHVQLEPLARVHVRTILMLVGLLFAINLLIPQFGEFHQTLTAARHADAIWLVFAVVTGFSTFAAAALSLSGAVLAPLAFGRTFVTQLASSFTNKITPAGLGGAGVNVRYLQRSGVSREDAIGAVALNGTTGLVVHVLALVLSAVLLGNVGIGHVHLPNGWTVLVVLVVVLALLGAVMETSFGRKRIVKPTERTARDLVAVLRQPRKAAQLLGGSLLVMVSYVVALGFALMAFHAHASWLRVTTVYLGGSAVASAAPTPGKVGAVEAALIAGLTGVGVASAPAVAGVLAFRLATFWLPIIPGWLAFRSLTNRQLL